MPDSFDLSFLGADYYALLPDYSANALWAGRPEKIPAGLYHMRITDTRSSLLRGREYLVFSLLILEGARRGRTIEVRFNVLSPVPTVRRRCYVRIRNLQEVCGLGEADLINADQFRGREFRGYVWCEERRGQPVIDIACFYRSDGTWPGMEAVCGNGGNAGSGQSGMPDSAPGEAAPVSRPGCGSDSGDSGSRKKIRICGKAATGATMMGERTRIPPDQPAPREPAGAPPASASERKPAHERFFALHHPDLRRSSHIHPGRICLPAERRAPQS